MTLKNGKIGVVNTPKNLTAIKGAIALQLKTPKTVILSNKRLHFPTNPVNRTPSQNTKNRHSQQQAIAFPNKPSKSHSPTNLLKTPSVIAT
ncbi:MAG: hypothetical protein IGS23_11845 [Rivularia sp. T60_A2020_040]|nr:hypothetical protein [Rivularia sp. T60_A2020_040]